jgi:hypothetical protein
MDFLQVLGMIMAFCIASPFIFVGAIFALMLFIIVIIIPVALLISLITGRDIDWD